MSNRRFKLLFSGLAAALSVVAPTSGQAAVVEQDSRQTPDTSVRIRTTVWVPDGDSLKIARSVESLGGPNTGDSIWGTRIGVISTHGLDSARALIVKDKVGSQLTALYRVWSQDSVASGRAFRFQPSDAHPIDDDPKTQRGGFGVLREGEDHIVVRTSVAEVRGQLRSINSTLTRVDEGVILLIGTVTREFAEGKLTRLSVIEYGGRRVVNSR